MLDLAVSALVLGVPSAHDDDHDGEHDERPERQQRKQRRLNGVQLTKVHRDEYGGAHPPIVRDGDAARLARSG